jgi:hypothetical protein
VDFWRVFSGHFHLRQQKKTSTTLATAFRTTMPMPATTARGMMILEWGKAPCIMPGLINPLYKVLKLSQVIDGAPSLLAANMHVRVELDIDISYEEANFIKDTFVKDYNLREMALIPVKAQQ